MVADNGTGFDVDALSEVGFGLRSMRQRAAQIGANLNFSSSGSGSVVTIVLGRIDLSERSAQEEGTK